MQLKLSYSELERALRCRSEIHFPSLILDAPAEGRCDPSEPSKGSNAEGLAVQDDGTVWYVHDDQQIRLTVAKL